MLAQRVATAVVGVPAILGLIAWGGPAYSVAIAAVLVIAALEFFAAADPAQVPARPQPVLSVEGPVEGRARRLAWAPAVSRLLDQRPPALLGAAAVALLVAGAHNGADWWTGALVLSLALLALVLILQGDVSAGLSDWLWVSGGLLYVGFLGSHLVLLRRLDDGFEWAILAVFATFATDTAAYFVGRAVGSVHITPAISPGKTLEGSLGGIAGGIAAVFLLDLITGLDTDTASLLLLALLLPLAAEIGDLAESLIKRGAGVKDASGLVPGHGGFLDRLDSLLFTAPLVYYFVIWVID